MVCHSVPLSVTPTRCNSPATPGELRFTGDPGHRHRLERLRIRGQLSKPPGGSGMSINDNVSKGRPRPICVADGVPQGPIVDNPGDLQFTGEPGHRYGLEGLRIRGQLCKRPASSSMPVNHNVPKGRRLKLVGDHLTY